MFLLKLLKFQRISSDFSWTLGVFLFADILLGLNLIINVKALVVLFIFLTFLLLLKLKSLFISLLLSTLFSLQFFSGIKFVLVEVIPSTELLNSDIKDHYFLGYGLNLTSFLLIPCFLTAISLCFQKKGEKRVKKIIFLLVPLVLFFFTASFSIFNYSPFLELSLVWLIQYMQVGIVSFCLVCLFVFFPKKYSLIIIPLVFTLLLQAYISFQQFFHQNHLGMYIEQGQGGAFYTGADENSTFLRPDGTFIYPTQFAFICSLLALIILPATDSKKIFYKIALVATFAVILFSQTRSVWVAWFLIVLIFGRKYVPSFKNFIKIIFKRRTAIYFLLLSPFFLIFIPRLILSLNFFEKDGGGSLRSLMIQEAAQAVQGNPFWGYGVATNEYVLHKLFPNGVMSTFPAAVHLGFFQLALEVGIIGSILFILPFFITFRNVVVNGKELKFFSPYFSKKKKNNTYADSFLACFIIMVCYYAFQPYLGITEFPYLGIVLAQGIILFLAVKKHDTEENA